MSGSFMDQLDTVTVAVAFDRRSVPLATAAAGLCRQIGKRLCLLHVVEPWMELADGLPRPTLREVTHAVERTAVERARARLEELAGTVGDGLPPVERRVVTGKPAEQLGREALAVGSCLLIVGADFGSLRFLPRGLSTALSLLVSSPVPVLVADPDRTGPLLPASRRLLVADDLGPQSDAALELAFGLAAALGRAELRHVHVNAVTLDGLRAGLQASDCPVGTAEEVYDALLASLGQSLSERADGAGRDYLEEAGGTYLPEVVTGPVSERLAEVSEATDPGLVVFGRHKPYDTKPFFIGRLPYRSMLALRRPLVVVPSD